MTLPTYSGEDITIANMIYSVTLSDLRENTTYYVHIVATNTVDRSTTSSMERFTTSLVDLGNIVMHDPYMQFSFTKPQYMQFYQPCMNVQAARR